MGSLSISIPMPTTNLRFHPFNPVTLPELILQWKADYTKAWEIFCPISEYLYFFLAKASSYKPEPYMIADLFLCGIGIHFIDFYPFLMKGDRVKMRIQLLPLVNHKELVLMFSADAISSVISNWPMRESRSALKEVMYLFNLKYLNI